MSAKRSALERFIRAGGYDELDPVERLRFFCSLAMTENGDDWLDVEQFFDDIIAEREAMKGNMK